MSGKIINFNCDGMCSQKTCNQPYTHFIIRNVCGMDLFIPLCERHYNEIQDFIFKEDHKQDNISNINYCLNILDGHKEALTIRQYLLKIRESLSQ